MQCIPINDIRFSQESIAAIKLIRKKNQLAVVLVTVLPAGAMVNIFLGNGSLQSSYNVYQTVFESLAKAMVSVSPIHRRVIQDIATRQALFSAGKESLFWRGVADGCAIH